MKVDIAVLSPVAGVSVPVVADTTEIAYDDGSDVSLYALRNDVFRERMVEVGSALRSEYESQIEDLERDVERLQNEKQTLIADRQEKQELVEYVEEEKTYRKANILTRARWWLTGMDDD